MMFFRRINLIFLMLTVTAVLIFGISLTQNSINREIKTNKLQYAGEIKNAPPLVAFTTVALGSFRGLLSNFLWLRAMALKDEGKYYEQVQLASWIADLQPNIPETFKFLAWNMAYNISITTSVKEDRWRWIKEGIKVLRNKGIRYNPDDAQICRELGWIFQHKIGEVMDEEGMYYKNRLALEVVRIVGNNPNWELLAAAPKSFAEFNAEYKNNAAYQRAMKDTGWDDTKLLDEFKVKSELPAAFAEKLKDPDLAVKISNFLRAEWLRDEMNMEAANIDRINKTYGELDWRTPEANSIYWFDQAMSKGLNNDQNVHRALIQSLRKSFANGRMLTIDNNMATAIYAPNFNVLKSTYDEIKKFNDNYPQWAMTAASISFLNDVVRSLYDRGDMVQANMYYGILHKVDKAQKVWPPLDVYMMKNWEDFARNSSMKKVNELLIGRMMLSYFYLAYGEDSLADSNRKIAKKVYDIYRQENAERWVRMGFPEWKEIERQSLYYVLQSYPEFLGRALAQRMKFNYDEMMQKIKEQAEEQEQTAREREDIRF